MATYSSTEGLDIWEKLGNKGWGSKEIQPYLRSFQNFDAGSDEETRKSFGLQGISPQGGDKGPIKSGYYSSLGDVEKDFVKTFNSIASEAVVTDPVSGCSNLD